MALAQQKSEGLVTAEELLEFPRGQYRYELVRGEVRRMTPAGSRHGMLAVRIGGLLDAHVRAYGLGVALAAETGFQIASDPDTVRAPDAAFVTRERVERVGLTESYWPGAPDLAVEVVSPSDSYTEVEAKALDWLAAGTRLVLVVDSRRRTVTAYRSPADIRVMEGDAVLDASDVVAGWSLPLSDLFDQ